MNYSEAVKFLYDLRVFGLKFGLENTRRLAALAGNPQEQLRFIHVAGTNGKGSTCAMLESIYRNAGLRVALFTSPHLVSFAERIQVNRKLISEEDVARLVKEIKGLPVFSGGAEHCPTFFEAVTVMALKYFAEQKCELVIWETGMGGRLDATNIVTPLASVITNVQLDHQQWLGNTLSEIAREKAGIIKEKVPVITAAAEPEVLRVITETARERHAPLSIVTQAEADAINAWEIALPGAHQRLNAALAVKTTEILRQTIEGVPPLPSPLLHKGVEERENSAAHENEIRTRQGLVSESILRRGLKETHWAGRCQLVRRPDGQTILLDGAHNPAGAQALAETWRREFPGKEAALVLGIMRDKDTEAICNILAPLARQIFLAPVGSERAADPPSLAESCRRANPSAQTTVCASLADALKGAANAPFIVLTGSLYFVGEALELLGLSAPSQERALNEYGSAPQGGSSIRAVTFDIGGTLIEPWPSVGHVYGRVAERHGLRVSSDVLNERFAAAWKAKKDFSHRKSDWSELVDRTFAGLSPTPPSATFFPELYDSFANVAAWRIFDDVRPCLERLRRAGFKLAAISNWDERLRPLLRALKLDQYFDAIVISGEEGCQKPDPEIFRTAARQLELPPQSILHIGDSRREDLEGARAAGCKALLLSRGGVASRDEVIITLDELTISAGQDKGSLAIAEARLISF